MRRRILVRLRGPAGQPAGKAPRACAAFTEFRPELYRFLLRRLRSAATAEDLAQEVYLRLLRTADTTRVRSPQAYLYRIAFNVLYEHRLRERGAPLVFDSQAVATAAESLRDDTRGPDARLEESHRTAHYERLVASLPPMQRAVLRLATHHDLSHAQIAQTLGISVSTMRNHLYKAIEECRQRMREPS